MKKQLFGLMMGLVMATASLAAIEVHHFDNAEDETRYKALIEELRCPKCQNQSLAGSDAPIAQDLKQKTYEMIQDGRSDTEIRTYMIERYGDFITYKPPIRPSTWILWVFPPLLLIGLLLGWLYQAKKGKPPQTASNAVALSQDEENRLKQLLYEYQNLPSATSQAKKESS